MTCQRCGNDGEVYRLFYERVALTRKVVPPHWSHETFLCQACFEAVDSTINEFIADQLKPKETP